MIIKTAAKENPPRRAENMINKYEKPAHAAAEN
jgi:hypothetical protein